MLVTMSVINRISILMTLKQFDLEAQLTIVMSVEAAMKQILDL